MNKTNKISRELSGIKIVNASAGSGKTYALAKRYIQVLLTSKLNENDIPIKNILALTFTNKAAFEMKERIIVILKKIAFGCEEEDLKYYVKNTLKMNVNDASLKAFSLLDDIIRYYNFFQVDTIDSFIKILISGCAFKMGLTSNFKIKTNRGEYVNRSLDNIIDGSSYDKNIMSLFRAFLNNYMYLENRTGWFPRNDIAKILKELSDKYDIYDAEFVKYGIDSDVLIKKKNIILNDIKSLLENLPDGINATFSKSLTSFVLKNPNSFDIDSISDSFARNEIPSLKNAKIPSEINMLWSKIRKDLKKLSVMESFSLFDPYVELFLHLKDEMYKMTSADDIIFLSELNRKIRLIFDEKNIGVDELYYRLATKFRHYLLDEFQDTSRLQWSNLFMLVEESLSTGGSLFYVGDKKQAIYGFRGGDLDLFNNAYKQFHEIVTGVSSLTTNWRSEKAIVDLNNTLFSEDNIRRFIAAREDDEVKRKKKVHKRVVFGNKEIRSVADVFKEAVQTNREDHNGGYVKIERIEEKDKTKSDEIIREKVINTIGDLLDRFDAKDIAIIVKTNSHVEQVTGWLLEEDIMAESERTLNIKENILIKDILSFLSFLSSPIDNRSFALFISSDMFSEATGLRGEDVQSFLFKIRKSKGPDDIILYRKFRSTYRDVWTDFIEEFFSNVGLYPLYELVVSIYMKFKCIDNFPEYQAFLMHFLELIKKNEDEGLDVETFLKYFDELEGNGQYIKISESNAIKILTVHKSKGLEFPVVIIPFLGIDVKVGGGGVEKTPSYVLRHSGIEMRLVRLKDQYYKFSETLKAIYDDEYKEALISELNKIYVSLTRPKKELYLFLPYKIGQSNNIANLFIPDEVIEIGTKKKYPSEKSKANIFMDIPASKYTDWILYIKDEFDYESDIKNRKKFMEGNIVHFIMSKIGEVKEDDYLKKINNAIKKAEMQFNQIENIDEIKQSIVNIINRIELKEIFFCEGSSVFTEYELVNRYGHTRRIDRLVVNKKNVIVADYKTSDSAIDKDKEQISEYIDMLKDIYKGRKVKGILLYINSLRIEAVDG